MNIRHSGLGTEQPSGSTYVSAKLAPVEHIEVNRSLVVPVFGVTHSVDVPHALHNNHDKGQQIHTALFTHHRLDPADQNSKPQAPADPLCTGTSSGADLREIVSAGEALPEVDILLRLGAGEAAVPPATRPVRMRR